MTMKTSAALLLQLLDAIAAIASSSAEAGTNARDKQLLKLAPETRLEQRCDARAMGLVNREHKNFRADEFVAYAFADPIIRGEMIKAPGGAIRNGNMWYRMSYVCETSNEGMTITSFSYQLGEPVPRQEWDQHFLVPK